MNTNISLTKFQKYTEKLSWVCVAGGFLLTLVRFRSLPYRVPTHFDVMGQPDAWGERSSVFLLAGMMVVLCVLVSVANRLPLRWVNLPFKVRQGREEAVLSAVRDMSVLLQLEAVVLMVFIQRATLDLQPLPSSLVFGLTAVMLLTVAGGVWRCWKRNG